MDELIIYVIKWDNGDKYGFFNGDNLEQCANCTDVGNEIKYLSQYIYPDRDVKFKFVDYSDIVRMRTENGFKQKEIV